MHLYTFLHAYCARSRRPWAAEHWNSMTPPDRKQQGRTLYLQAYNVQLIMLRDVCTQFLLGLGQPKNRHQWNMHKPYQWTYISHSEKATNSVDHIHCGSERPKLLGSVFPLSFIFQIFFFWSLFQLQLDPFQFRSQKSPANITAMMALLNVRHKRCWCVDITAYTRVTLQKWRWRLRKWE